MRTRVIWLVFIGWAAAVVAAGTVIGPVTAALGERMRLGQAWAGTVLLSFATTLPELVSTVTVAGHGEVGLALGNIVGSCIFNLFLLVIVDVMARRPLYDRLSADHIATGLLGCALLALLIVGVALGHVGLFGPAGPQVGSVGVTAIAILILYCAGQFVVYRLAQQSYQEPEHHRPSAWEYRPVPVLVLVFFAVAAVIVVSAYRLGITVEEIAARYALGATFAGATLLGIVTSLPEMTNGIASARRGQLDLVLGNVLGANAFLLFVLAMSDVVFLAGALFYAVGRTEAMSAIIMAATAIVMQSIVLGGIAIRSRYQLWRIGLVSIVLAGLYVFSLVVAYGFGQVPQLQSQGLGL